MGSMMRWWVLAALAVLTACAATRTPEPTNVCPPVKPYPADLQQAVAGELQRLDVLIPGNHIHGFMDDYERLRDAARACAHP